MKIALLCSGLGNVYRGHEIFADDLFRLLSDSVDITLFKGGGEQTERQQVVPNIPRNSPLLAHVKVAASPKWASAVREQERLRIETETFAYAALQPLLEGGFDVIHCLEQEVCNILYAQRHLFEKTPKILFSNGGAIPGRELPNCDFVQEHTDYNLSKSLKHKAFMIPHGIDTTLFDRDNTPDGFRARHGIPENATLVISVGTICYWHKRMDYVIREIAPLKHLHLLIVGQECADTPEILQLGKERMGERITFTRMAHDKLPEAYKAADVFVLGSLFETFGIVYIEAMSMKLPVICTQHINQRSIVQEGIFIDMKRPGALTEALREPDRQHWAALGERGRQIACEIYDLKQLRQRYIERYQAIAATPALLPRHSFGARLSANLKNALRRSKRLW